MSVMIVTSLGDIVVDLFTDRCPLTSKNFLKLCKIKYYNGCLFHTVQKDFTAQTGDPTGTGTGGDSVYKFLYGDQARFFSDEIHLDLKHSKTGTLAMASAGENLNASQFYFTLRGDLDYLDGKHTIFLMGILVAFVAYSHASGWCQSGYKHPALIPNIVGKWTDKSDFTRCRVFGEVAEGLETLTRINEAYVDEKGRPFKNIRIKHTYILDDPFDNPSQLIELIPDASPEGKPKDEVDDDVRLEDDWVPLDEQLDAAELEELIRSKEAHSRAVVLETIGDIPDAEIKPPDNVLFVCKLNPVTEDEDLHTIFSRFGTVISAEIIRDYKTGDSLCYAFIEFETEEACEQAYFKMDNALIDDRRIHVDFSQSVSKLWSQYRRRDHQKGQGRGCFKCGGVDHIAKDCTSGSPSKQQQPPKYILKENNTQRGGDDNSRYEMVFDEENTSESPKREKRHHRGHGRDRGSEDRIERDKLKRQGSEDWKRKEHDRDSDHGHGHRHNGDRDRRYGDEKGNQERRGSSRSSGSTRHPSHHQYRSDREKHRDRRDEVRRERDDKTDRERYGDRPDEVKRKRDEQDNRDRISRRKT